VSAADSSSQNSDQRRAGAAATGWRLAVLGGLHAGAALDLPTQGGLLIGAAADCDILLKDAGVLPHHALVLALGQGRVELRAIDGAVRRVDSRLEPGASIAVEGVDMFALGSACVGVGPEGHSEWADLTTASLAEDEESALRPVQAEVSTDEHDIDDPLTQQPEQLATFVDPPSSSDEQSAARQTQTAAVTSMGARATSAYARRRRWALATASACGLGLVISIGWQAASQSVRSNMAKSALDETLAELAAPEVTVVRSDNGVVRLEGVVTTEQQRTRVLELLRKRGIAAAVDIVSGDQLAQAVHSGFRQRGISVQTLYAGKGRVRVSGVGPTPQAEQVVVELLRSRSAVSEIELVDLPKETVVSAPAPSVPALQATARQAGVDEASAALSDKAARDPRRVVGVVGGSQPFVLTQDGKRYLVGATLPDGSQIQKITGQTVVFVRNGKPMPVRF
jgi:type III secretion system YscD/HrpQ family protein